MPLLRSTVQAHSRCCQVCQGCQLDACNNCRGCSCVSSTLQAWLLRPHLFLQCLSGTRFANAGCWGAWSAGICRSTAWLQKTSRLQLQPPALRSRTVTQTMSAVTVTWPAPAAPDSDCMVAFSQLLADVRKRPQQPSRVQLCKKCAGAVLLRWRGAGAAARLAAIRCAGSTATPPDRCANDPCSAAVCRCTSPCATKSRTGNASSGHMRAR